MYIEFAGAGWFGEVYQIGWGRWAWALGVEMNDRAKFAASSGYFTCSMAERSMRSQLSMLLAARAAAFPARLHEGQ